MGIKKGNLLVILFIILALLGFVLASYSYWPVSIKTFFKFLNPEATIYTCPSSGWLDCMPGLGGEKGIRCANVDWYEKNCPNFQGVAQ